MVILVYQGVCVEIYVDMKLQGPIRPSGVSFCFRILDITVEKTRTNTSLLPSYKCCTQRPLRVFFQLVFDHINPFKTMKTMVSQGISTLSGSCNWGVYCNMNR